MLIHLPREEGYGIEPADQERAGAGRLRRRHDEERARRHDHHAARAAAPLADLGPRQGDCRAARRSSRSTPASRSTSPTRTAPGSAAPTRTPTACCASTSPRAPTCPAGAAEELDAVAAALNSRPRKTLGWKTPAEALNEQLLLAATSRCCDDRLNPPCDPRSVCATTESSYAPVRCRVHTACSSASRTSWVLMWTRTASR